MSCVCSYSHFVARTHSSLRDAMPQFDNPTLERVGYSRISLREIGNVGPTCPISSPWDKSHGYHHRLSPRGSHSHRCFGIRVGLLFVVASRANGRNHTRVFLQRHPPAPHRILSKMSFHRETQGRPRFGTHFLARRGEETS